MGRIKLTLREPAQHARLPDPGIPEHEQPAQDVVLLSHDHELEPRRKHDSSAGSRLVSLFTQLLCAAFTAPRKSHRLRSCCASISRIEQ